MTKQNESKWEDGKNRGKNFPHLECFCSSFASSLMNSDNGFPLLLYTPTHVHSHEHAHPLTLMHTHANPPMLTHTHPSMLTHAHPHTITPSHIHAHTHTHPSMLTHTHIHPCSHMHTHSRSHTHTHPSMLTHAHPHPHSHPHSYPHSSSQLIYSILWKHNTGIQSWANFLRKVLNQHRGRISSSSSTTHFQIFARSLHLSQVFRLTISFLFGKNMFSVMRVMAQVADSS